MATTTSDKLHVYALDFATSETMIYLVTEFVSSEELKKN